MVPHSARPQVFTAGSNLAGYPAAHTLTSYGCGAVSQVTERAKGVRHANPSPNALDRARAGGDVRALSLGHGGTARRDAAVVDAGDPERDARFAFARQGSANSAH